MRAVLTRTRVAGVAAVAVVTAALTTTGTTSAAAAVPSTVTPLTTNVLSPEVVRPAQQVPVSIAFGNQSPLAGQIQVTFKGYCFNSGGVKVDFVNPSIVATVPGDKNPPPLGIHVLKVVAGTVTVPATCTHQSDLEVDGAFLGDIGNPGEQPWGTLLSLFHIGKTFTAANFRYNLALRTHGAPAESDAHHELPQKFRPKFVTAGLNIDDPQYGRWWCNRPGVPSNHTAQAANYNARWDTFFMANTNPPPTAGQIVTFMDSIQTLYVYACP